jgi:hypothetical protein
VAGFVMTLVTSACEPASCFTMLPQKFSAATTVIRPAGRAAGRVVPDAPAGLATPCVTSRPAATATRNRPPRRRGGAVRTGRAIKLASAERDPSTVFENGSHYKFSEGGPSTVGHHGDGVGEHRGAGPGPIQQFERVEPVPEPDAFLGVLRRVRRRVSRFEDPDLLDPVTDLGAQSAKGLANPGLIPVPNIVERPRSAASTSRPTVSAPIE